MQEELNNILLFLKIVKDSNDLGNDNKKIKYLYNELNKMQNKLPSEKNWDKLQKIEIELEIKYDCLNELSYYFDPLYVTIKKSIHEKNVSKLRNYMKNNKNS